MRLNNKPQQNFNFELTGGSPSPTKTTYVFIKFVV